MYQYIENMKKGRNEEYEEEMKKNNEENVWNEKMKKEMENENESMYLWRRNNNVWKKENEEVK